MGAGVVEGDGPIQGGMEDDEMTPMAEECFENALDESGGNDRFGSVFTSPGNGPKKDRPSPRPTFSSSLSSPALGYRVFSESFKQSTNGQYGRGKVTNSQVSFKDNVDKELAQFIAEEDDHGEHGLRSGSGSGHEKGTDKGGKEISPKHGSQNNPKDESQEMEEVPTLLNEANFQLAIYIAMAHAGLVLLVLFLYGLGRLLKDVWKPIQWAVLCSMPLREVQEVLVTFWTAPLEAGMVETIFALPLVTYRAVMGTILDAKEAILRLFLTLKGEGKHLGPPKPVGFVKLFQWLVSFAFLTVGIDVLGPGNLSLVAFVGLIMYAAGAGTGFEVSHLRTALSHNGRRKTNSDGQLVDWEDGPISRFCKAANQRMSRKFVGSLHTLVALGLIFTMIVGSLGGLALFTYKMGMEGTDAVVIIKDHMDKNDYKDKVGSGFNNWVQDNNVPEMIDTYVVKGYDMLMEQVDLFAAKNNLTEFVDMGKDLLLGIISDNDGSMNQTEGKQQSPLVLKLYDTQKKVRALDFYGTYTDIEEALRLFLEHFQMGRDDFWEKAKDVAQRSTDVGKRVLSSGSTMVQGGASVFLFISRAIASGAAEVINFITQSAVFFSVLYYLITSQTGGVMEQILGMIPLSEPTRNSCAKVLDHAVSSVLLATAKVAFFQASFTWLLFWFCDIHFLYGLTLMALVQAFLPVFPSWLISLPLLIEYAMERRFILGIVCTGIHIYVMDYGMDKIQSEIPGHNAYLTGLSIAGGMAFFTPAMEGAIMGPLLMTVMIAVKNLYAEFVLSADKAALEARND